MKKLPMIALVTALASTAAFAQNGGFQGPGTTPNTNNTTTTQQGGFSGPSASVTTVAEALKMRDDSWITLRGNIEQQVGHDRYIFRDSTGTVTVEIDKKYWNGQTITPKDKVEIQGEVDKDWNEFEIDVKRITKIN